MGVPEGWGSQNVALFFSFSPIKLHSLCSLWASFRGISVVFDVLGLSKMHVGSSLGHRVRAPAARSGLGTDQRLRRTVQPLAEVLVPGLGLHEGVLPPPHFQPGSNSSGCLGSGCGDLACNWLQLAHIWVVQVVPSQLAPEKMQTVGNDNRSQMEATGGQKERENHGGEPADIGNPRRPQKRGGRDRKLGGGEDAPEVRECHRVAVRSMARRRTSARPELKPVIRGFRESKYFPKK